MSGQRVLMLGKQTFTEYANVPFAIRRINSDTGELKLTIPKNVAQALLDCSADEKRLFRLTAMLWVDEERTEEAAKALPIPKPKPDQVCDDRAKALASCDHKGSGFKSAETALSSARRFILKCLKKYPSEKTFPKAAP